MEECFEEAIYLHVFWWQPRRNSWIISLLASFIWNEQLLYPVHTDIFKSNIIWTYALQFEPNMLKLIKHQLFCFLENYIKHSNYKMIWQYWNYYLIFCFRLKRQVERHICRCLNALRFNWEDEMFCICFVEIPCFHAMTNSTFQ